MQNSNTASPTPANTLTLLFGDREYFRNIFRLAWPIAVQQGMYALLNMVSVIFVSQLGETSVAAVALAGQISFLLNLVHFGVVSGAAMFSAQFWGNNDVPNLRRVLGICLGLALSVSLFFFLLSQIFPEQVLRLYSNEADVLALGRDYVRIYSWYFPFYAISFSFAYVMRSTGDVKTPTLIGAAALILSTVLSYALIFGKFGLPKMGIEGAALATVIARALECLVLLAVAYGRKSPAAGTLRELFDLDRAFIARILRPMMPVIWNELLWSLGITTYYAIYGHMGQSALAAINITSTIEQVAFVAFIGLTNATAVLVGNRIGEGKEDEAYRYGGYTLRLGALGGILIGLLVQALKGFILSFYDLPPDVLHNISLLLNVTTVFMWVRINNMAIVVGILRAGGDTRYSLFLDGFIIWMVGVPLTALGALYFHLPVQWVLVCAMGEEATKWILGIRRYRSRKWINNLAHHV